jgi:hypothetical protein
VGVLVQLAVPGSGRGGQFLNVLSRRLFVGLYNLFCDIMWLEYVVNKMQVAICWLEFRTVSAKQSKQSPCHMKWILFPKWCQLG